MGNNRSLAEMYNRLQVQKGCDQLDFIILFFGNLVVKVCPTLWLTFYANYLEHFCVLIISCIYYHIHYLLLDSTCSEHCKTSNLALWLCTRSWQGHWGISELSLGVGSIQVFMANVSALINYGQTPGMGEKDTVVMKPVPS